MKNIRSLADRVIESYIKRMDGRVDCYHESQMCSSLFRQSSKSVGYKNIQIDNTVGIISYPFKKNKLEDCQMMTNLFGFDIKLIRSSTEIPFYFENINLILPRDDAMHRLTILWDLSKTGTYELKVEKMVLPECFFEFLVIDKKNKTANGFTLCDVEVDFLLELKKIDRRLRVKKNILNWIKSKFTKFALV